MYSWRAQIGVIAPSVSPNIERDFARFAPDGVGVATTRIEFSGNPIASELQKMVDRLSITASIYKSMPHDCVVFGCTSGSLIGGMNFDKQCCKTIEEACGCKGLTTSTAVLEAFSCLKTGTTAVLTPYPDETNNLERQFLEDNGIHVTCITGMKFKEPRICYIGPETVYQHIKQLNLAGAESIFISCTGLNVLDIIEDIETDFGLPVITSNQSTLWSALRHSRVKTRIPYLGKLLTL